MDGSPAKNFKVVAFCGAITLGMLGMSYAAVPLYKIFCQVTGYGGTTQRADVASATISDKSITVRFDANVSTDLNWEFAPKVRSVTLKVGETGQAVYRARNIESDVSFGTASFNVSPQAAGAYFNKLECFCFTEQVLAPGERVQMPVSFFIDPEIVKDRDGKYVHTITLSYTFYEIDLPEAQAALDTGDKTNLN